MGFWNGLGKLISGKPVFDTSSPEDAKNAWDDDAPTVDYAEERDAKRQEHAGNTAVSLYDANGNKQIPEAGVSRVKYILSGNAVEVWATIQNHSQSRDLFLDKMTLCGQKWELDYPLGPGAERAFVVYKGSILKNDGYKKAELYYKDAGTGDYFRADHMVEYEYESQDGAYHVNSLELIRPINDI